MKTKSIVVGTGVCGVLAGFLLSANIGKNDLVKIATVATLLTAPIGIVAHSIGEGRGNSRANELEDKLSKKELDAGCIQNELKSALEKISKLGSELSKIQQNLKDLTLERDSYRVIAESSKPTVEALQKDLEKSLKAIANWESKCAELQQKCEDWESSFASELETLAEQEVEHRLREIRLNEIKQVCAENDDITDQAMALMRRMRAWSQKLVQKHDSQKEFVHQLTDAYNGNLDKVIGKIDDINQSFDKERDGYLTQIDCLHQRIALLQHELNGDLVEPEYGRFGYQWDARIVDDIARKCWDMLQIPLAVEGYKINQDGSAEGGYRYSQSQPVEALVKDLSGISEQIAKDLGIHKIINIQKHDLSDLLIISWRCERPKPVSEEAIYRLMQPARNCSQIIRDAMNHRKGGKPTLRVMSATGGGKGIVTKAFIADWVKSMSGEVWLSDPMDGSSEDFWECPKAAKSAREGSKLLSEFSAEFQARKNKHSQHKDTLVLGVFDEFDKQHPDSDKEKVQEIWTAIRHHDMRLILVGQSSEVGVNGWTWDAMKNCALLFVGNAITTATKQAKNIGISAANKRTIERDYDTIKNYLESKNDGLDSDVMYRVALLIVDDTYKFLELPPAYKGTIDNDKAVIVSRPWESLEEGNKPITQTLKTCPGCGGKLRKAGSKMRCENPEHTKDMGLKTFKLES